MYQEEKVTLKRTLSYGLEILNPRWLYTPWANWQDLRHFGILQLSGAFGGKQPGILLNTLQCTAGKSLTINNCLLQNVNSVKVEDCKHNIQLGKLCRTSRTGSRTPCRLHIHRRKTGREMPNGPILYFSQGDKIHWFLGTYSTEANKAER